MEFSKIILKDMSWKILCYLVDKEPMKAEEIGKPLGLTAKQVNAAVTKSLVRYGFVVREAKLTRLLKKQYNVIHITPLGKRFVIWKSEHDAERA